MIIDSIEYEPFDEALYQDQVALKKRVDDLQVKLAERYKRVPQEIKLLMEGALKRQSAAAMDVEFTGLDDNGVDESELLEKGILTVPIGDCIGYMMSVGLINFSNSKTEMPKRDQFVTKYRDIISTVNRLNNVSLMFWLAESLSSLLFLKCSVSLTLIIPSDIVDAFYRKVYPKLPNWNKLEILLMHVLKVNKFLV